MDRLWKKSGNSRENDGKYRKSKKNERLFRRIRFDNHLEL